MSVNDNGLIVQTIPYTDANNINYLTEGAIIGITFAWIIGSIGLYVLGLLLIRFCFKRYYQQSEDSSSKQPRPRKPSSSSSEGPALGNKNMSRREQGKMEGGKRKRYEQNPTLQQIKTTEQNSTYKKIKTYRGATINLEMEERIQPHEN